MYAAVIRAAGGSDRVSNSGKRRLRGIHSAHGSGGHRRDPMQSENFVPTEQRQGVTASGPSSTIRRPLWSSAGNLRFDRHRMYQRFDPPSI